MSGVKKAVFVASTMEEKEEWVAAIGRAITECGSRIGGQSEKRKELKELKFMSAMPVQSSATPVQSSATSVQSSATPMQSSVTPVQSSAMPVQSSATPMQSSATSVQSSVMSVRSSMRIAERGSKWLSSPDKTSLV